MAPDAGCFTSAVEACLRARKDQQAELLWRRMERTHQPDIRSFDAVLSVLSRRDPIEISVVEGWFNRILSNKLTPTRVSYNNMIFACGLARDHTLAKSHFDQLLHGRIQPDIVSLGSIIQACARGGDIASAERYLDLAGGYSLTPDLRCYTSLISGYASNAQPIQAEAILDKVSLI